jgi:TfoX/Sxy family transcriptional regulator of competence genes
MKNTMRTPINVSELLTRESLLRANSELILQLQERLKAKRFRPQKGDSLRLAYIRVFIQALQVQNVIMKDIELDEFKDRLEALESSQNLSGSPSYTPIFERIE